jgi:hypothetical protein
VLFKRESIVSTIYGKRFTLLKNVNHFSKFIKHFWSNGNHFSIDHYFRPYQTPKNTETIFQKSFYAEKKGASVILEPIMASYAPLPTAYWTWAKRVQRHLIKGTLQYHGLFYFKLRTAS